eukprot:9645234-Lingulodinium_polyedra.AAC.1
MGCARPPQAWPAVPATFGSVQQATQVWAGVVAVLEREVLADHDIVGAAAKPYCGRARPVAMVLRQVMPAKPRNRPRPTPEAL